MTENKIILEENKNYYERFSLAVERIRMIHTELWDQSVTLADKHLNSYFIKTSYFALQLNEIYNLSKNNILKTLTESELFHLNQGLYEDIDPASMRQVTPTPHMRLNALVPRPVCISVLSMQSFTAIFLMLSKNGFLILQLYLSFLLRYTIFLRTLTANRNR